MFDFLSLVPAPVALFIIIRRGLKPRRIKTHSLWIFPAVIAFLAVSAIANGKPPGLIAWIVYAGAVAAGAVFGWYTTQHVELTLDDKTGTVMLQPSVTATATTAAVFAARWLLDYESGGHGSHLWRDFLVAHGASLALITNTGLLFVSTRGLSRAWHMMARISPMLEAHRASKVEG